MARTSVALIRNTFDTYVKLRDQLIEREDGTEYLLAEGSATYGNAWAVRLTGGSLGTGQSDVLRLTTDRETAYRILSAAISTMYDLLGEQRKVSARIAAALR